VEAVKPRVDGGGLWLRKKWSGECGPGKLEGEGRTEGCPELWVMRRSLLRQRTRWGLNDSRGTTAVFGERRRSLYGRVHRVREGARELD
jgi:hypothetical protein